MNVFKYHISFSQSLQTSKVSFQFRKGLLFFYQHEGGLFAGETAPLPGFSNESLHDVMAEYGAGFKPKTWNEKNLDECVENARFPSLRFGLDSLRMALFHKKRFHAKKVRLKVNALISLAANNLLGLFNLYYRAGYRVFKCKIGMDLETEISQLEHLMHHFPEALFRLDANGALEFDQLEMLYSRLPKHRMDYIEQPFSDTDPKLPDLLARAKHIPIALDESARTISDIQNIVTFGLAKTVILKPMLIGSFSEIEAMISLCNQHGIRTVISSTLETAIARNHMAFLAAALAPDETHGLATGHLLSFDFSIWYPTIEKGFLQFQNPPFPIRLHTLSNHSCLQQIA